MEKKKVATNTAHSMFHNSFLGWNNKIGIYIKGKSTVGAALADQIEILTYSVLQFSPSFLLEVSLAFSICMALRKEDIMRSRNLRLALSSIGP